MTGSFVLLAPMALLSGWMLYVLYGFLVNYLAARKSGIRLIILPIDSVSPIWMVTDRKVTSFIRWLTGYEGSFTRFNWRGWEIHDRYKAHQELGDALLFVTPGKMYLQLCDAEAVAEIFQRRTEFPRPPEATEMLNVFGPNLGTTEGKQWQRHRRITASAFNEQIIEKVWLESIRQAAGMIQYWSSKPSINSVAEDCRTVSLHVMSGAAFGKSYPFRGAEQASQTSEDTSSNYGEALRIILDRCIPLVALGRKNLSISWLPKSFKELYRATLVFQDHMTKAYEDEKRAMAQGETQEYNLMTSLVRASQENIEKSSTESQQGLTEEEIYGNIFVFNFAGHDATANSLAYGVSLLATRPDVQSWIAEEMDHVLGDTASEASSYEAAFPRLKRCLAVAFETVRLYTAVAIAKSTGGVERTLTIGGKTVVIPANTMVIPNYSAMHTHPRYWGVNSLAFEPSRWVASDAAPSSTPTPVSVLDAETFKEPAKHASPFVGWSGGARNCPGKKFAQVEFVGVLVGLFHEYTVAPDLLPSEDAVQARLRLRKQIQEDSGMRLLLQILHPEKIVLRWSKRVA